VASVAARADQPFQRATGATGSGVGGKAGEGEHRAERFWKGVWDMGGSIGPDLPVALAFPNSRFRMDLSASVATVLVRHKGSYIHLHRAAKGPNRKETMNPPPDAILTPAARFAIADAVGKTLLTVTWVSAESRATKLSPRATRRITRASSSARV